MPRAVDSVDENKVVSLLQQRGAKHTHQTEMSVTTAPEESKSAKSCLHPLSFTNGLIIEVGTTILSARIVASSAAFPKSSYLRPLSNNEIFLPFRM